MNSRPIINVKQCLSDFNHNNKLRYDKHIFLSLYYFSKKDVIFVRRT